MAEKKNFLGKYVDVQQLHSIDFMKIWSYYDKDGSGFLDRKELDSFLIDLMGCKGKEVSDSKLSEFRDSVLKSVDVNKDGKIELGEFANLLPIEENFLRKFPARKKLSRQNFDEIFKHYDPDGNNFIEGKELLALIRDIMTKTDETVKLQDVHDYKEAVLRVFDKNDDGRLSRKELGLLLSVDDS